MCTSDPPSYIDHSQERSCVFAAMADTVAAITGLSAEEAASYLEMAGGNVESAVALYFDMAGGGGGGMAAAAPPAVPSGASAWPPCHTILFGAAAAPASWLEQGFELSSEPDSRCCLVQHKNGPCGVLAAVNAELIAQLGRPPPGLAADSAEVCAALGSILWRCASEGRVTLVTWAEGRVGGSLTEELFIADSAAVVAERLHALGGSLIGRGGCCLFCYACVLTRGIDAVKADTALDHAGPPLVVGPHALCSTELLNLFLAGVARGNVGAYGSDGKKVGWRPRRPVGLLSRDEIESGMPLADELKSPTAPVFILHGGDHFTIAWAPAPTEQLFESRVRTLFAQRSAAGADPNAAAAAALEQAAAELKGFTPPPPADAAGCFDLVLWNGLPPNRKLARLRLRGCGAPTDVAPAAPPTHQPTQWKQTPNEVESIVQAAPADKKASPGRWKLHKYEISLMTQAVAAEDASAPRPESAPPPVRLDPGPPPPAGATWRCASCYNSRFKKMCFGENAAPSGSVCKFCGLAPAVAGWTLWKHYSELPLPIQARVDRANGPKVLAVLRTRWGGARVSAVAANGAEAELGGETFDPTAFTVPAV
jgi:hypothetical protein